MKKLFLAFLLLSGSGVAAGGASLPDLKTQSGWSEKEKQEFLGFIKSNQPLPAGGQVKAVPAGNSKFTAHKARFASLAIAADTMMLDAGGGRTKTETTTLGPKFLVGGHLFSWVRYYAGLKYNRIGQEKLDGSRAHLSHIEAPVGLELALIPLGTPHTRYVLLRGGVSGHIFSGPAKKSDFKAPLLGWHPAWNLGLGYEWQFDNSNWRFNTLAEGCRSFSSSRAHFSALNLTAAFVYTF